MELKRAAIDATEREESKTPYSVVGTAKPGGEENGEITEEKAGFGERKSHRVPRC